MNNTIKVLDHGYVKLLNVAGPVRRPDQAFDASDVDPANVARKSFDQMSQRDRASDLKLNDYLLRQNPPHSEPFEFIECWFEMKLPLFVAAQMKRHRTARLWDPTEDVYDPSIDEMSMRYVQAYREWYVPEETRVTLRPQHIKQGSGDEIYEHSGQFVRELDALCASSYERYEHYLKEGVAPELCRAFLHVNTYTGWAWKQDLWNVFHLLACRDHSHAQFEARAYAEAIGVLLKKELPELMRLYETYRKAEQ